MSELKLPCHPCPHDSVCCSRGTILTPTEYGELSKRFGEWFFHWDVDEQAWRTTYRRGSCLFFDGRGCQLHDDPYYPVACRLFPHADPGGGPCESASMCPSVIPKEALVRRR